MVTLCVHDRTWYVPEAILRTSEILNNSMNIYSPIRETLLIPTLHMRKLRHRNQDNEVNKWQSPYSSADR